MSGCGKSVLASAIVNKLDTKSSNQAIAHTLYYFCQSGSEKTTTRDLLRVLLSQTFERQKNDIGFKLQNSLSGISVCNADTEKSDEEGDNELLQLLVESIRQLDKKVYIVIDGLDYCSADHFTISNFINTILRGTTECRPSVLLTSQSEGQNVFRQLDDGFKSSWVQFEITKHDTAEDLKALIEHRLQSQTPLCDLSSELQQEIVCTILARANGMFLYASLLLDELTSDSIPILSPRAVRFALQQLPKTLTQMYHSQLAIAAKSPYGYGGEICRWVFTSMRPLTWNEIRNALAVYDGHYDEENLIQDTASCDSVIRKWCGSLVETFGEKRLLRFVNPTVREYLGQDSDLSIRIGIPAAHSNVVSKLLVMLQLPDIPDLSQQDPRDVDAVIRKYSETSGRWLYPYAVLNWYRHLKFCGEDGIVNPELRDAVVEFLRSPQSLDWLVTALVMIKSDDGGRISSTAFANDFVDCLSTWLDRWDSAQNIEMKRSVESWTGDFLSLMIDWGAAIERDPFNIYSIHLNLLPEEHTFRDFLVDRSYQSVMELAARTPFTRSCQNAPWFRDVFAVDSERKLAFTFQSNYLRCFLISTGLLVSERRFGSPTARFVRAKLSPNDRYIAMVLEEIPLVDPKTSENISKIREGQQLTILNKLAWCLECDQDEEQTQAIAEMIGIPKACYNVYVVQLNQDGLSSTKMFSTLPGKSKSLVTSYTRSIIWQIDEPHVLEFSSNGPKLATVNGTILLDDGDLLPLKAEEQVSRLGRGTKITEDLQMTVFMKSRNCVGQYDSQVDRTIPKTLSGIGHILAISDRGRFVLLLTVRKTGPLNSTNGNHISGPQKSTISIYDFRTDRMTELLTLMPTKRLAPWKLQDVQFPACFSPENSKRMCVLVCSLKEWNIAPNVHCANGYDDITSIAESPHILIFDGGPKPGSGFGQNPVLRYTADIKDLTIETCLECSSSSKSKEMSPLEAIPCSKQLTWSEDDFQTGILSKDGKMKLVKVRELQEAILNFPKNPRPSQSTSWMSSIISFLLVSPNQDGLYYIRVIPSCNSRSESQVESQANLQCEITITAVRKIDRRPLEWKGNASLSFRSSNMQQFVSVSHRSRIVMGSLEIKLNFENDTFSATSTQEDPITVKASRAFEKLRKSQPFQSVKSPETMNSNTSSSNSATREAILSPFRQSIKKVIWGIKDLGSYEEALESEKTEFMKTGSQTCQDSLHFYQFARLSYAGQVFNGRRREPQCFEICLCIFDERLDSITWMVHTYTAGACTQSEMLFPETAWALHPSKPLLVWLLPGHKLRISCIQSHRPPISLCGEFNLIYFPIQLKIN